MTGSFLPSLKGFITVKSSLGSEDWSRGSSGGSAWGGTLGAALWRGSSGLPTPLPSLSSHSFSPCLLFSQRSSPPGFKWKLSFPLRSHHIWLTIYWIICLMFSLPWPWGLFILIHLTSEGNYISFLSGPPGVWYSLSTCGPKVQVTKGPVFPWGCAVSLQRLPQEVPHPHLWLLSAQQHS